MLVSVIIPTYNRAQTVGDAVRSVQNQTYSNVQIIVVDDGSQDNTRELIKQHFAGVEYYYQENKRQAAARNCGLEKAHGELIATLDSDDAWDSEFLARSVETLRKNQLDFVFSNWVTKKATGETASAWERSGIWKQYAARAADNWFLLDAAQIRCLFINTCPAPSSSLLIKRDSLVSRWNTELKIADDWCLILDMALAKPCRAAFTLQPLWKKNVHGNNIYDGRSREAIAAELEIHDTRLLKKRYSEQLTLSEKNVFDRRIIKGKMILAGYFVKRLLGIKRSVKFW